jgi:RNA polymerase sigma-70 factor (ECF subfamily)
VALAQPHPAVLRRAQRGDSDAFSELVRSYHVPVFNYVLRLTGDRPLAEDVTQEVFLRLLRGLSQFSGRSTFTTWLFQIAKHRAYDELRALERRPAMTHAVDALDTLASIPAENGDTIERIWDVIGELDPDLRTALLLRDVVGLSYREIGDVLDIPLSTVKWRIYIARERVADAVHADEDAGARRAAG